MQELFILEDLFNVLVELETLANKHYIELANLTSDKKLVELFKQLAKFELSHKKLFLEYKSKAINFETNTSTTEYTRYMDALLKNTIEFLKTFSVCDNFKQGYKMAVNLEKDTIFFLTETKLIIGTEYHDEIDKIIDQEREHLRYLFEYIND